MHVRRGDYPITIWRYEPRNLETKFTKLTNQHENDEANSRAARVVSSSLSLKSVPYMDGRESHQEMAKFEKEWKTAA